jgi:hypothetical protein
MQYQYTIALNWRKLVVDGMVADVAPHFRDHIGRSLQRPGKGNCTARKLNLRRTVEGLSVKKNRSRYFGNRQPGNMQLENIRVMRWVIVSSYSIESA